MYCIKLRSSTRSTRRNTTELTFLGGRCPGGEGRPLHPLVGRPGRLRPRPRRRRRRLRLHRGPRRRRGLRRRHRLQRRVRRQPRVGRGAVGGRRHALHHVRPEVLVLGRAGRAQGGGAVAVVHRRGAWRGRGEAAAERRERRVREVLPEEEIREVRTNRGKLLSTLF